MRVEYELSGLGRFVEKTRDDLIEDVKYGRIEPLAAEAEAKRLGLEPFARSPDPEKFDPLGEEWWTQSPQGLATQSWLPERKENHD